MRKPFDNFSEKVAWRARRLIMSPPLRGRSAQGPLVVAGFFRTASGVGQSARSCSDALMRHGRAHLCVDLSEIFGQVDMDADRALARLPDDPEGTLILHANAMETERALFKLALRRPQRWRIIGVWAWELATAPPAWLKRARVLSELWVLSEFVASAFRGRIDIPVKVVPAYVPLTEGSDDRASFGLETEALAVLAMADGRSSFERKNLLAAVRIFRAAAQGRARVRFLIKTRNIAEDPRFAAALAAAIAGDARIRHFDASLSPERQRALLAGIDIFLSPHRSEGFGLVLAEAMALGKAVVATGWSGNLDFMPDDAAALIPASLAPVAADLPVYGVVDANARWAEPDEAAGAAALAALLDDAELRRRLGARARETIAARLDGGAILGALK